MADPLPLRLALVAHDAKKALLVEWAGRFLNILSRAELHATGTTGSRLVDAHPDLSVNCLKSGPLGGDQQLGAMICEERLDGLIFFIDPLAPMPHDVDVKALTRIAVLYDLPMAISPTTADFLIRGITAKRQPSL
ncbi:MAG: methylglyoxal synthase [Pseudomonadota bacterium]